MPASAHHPAPRTHDHPYELIAGTHIVGPEEAGSRADVVVARAAGAPRSAVAAAFEGGRVLRNGRPVKASAAVGSGDLIEFDVVRAMPLELRPERIPLAIVYEDEDLVVVDKPAGMVTHPARGSRHGTLVNALLAHVGALPGEAPRPGLVHRLDRDTTGLIVVAKTEEALRSLGIAMQRRRVHREYLGLVAGFPEPERGTLEGPIGRDPRRPLRFAVRSDGRPAITHYETRERLRGASELAFRLETGRTHQIRVHMAAFGHPILGDPVYGRREAGVLLEGQALHAWRLGFRHPRSGAPLDFEVAPPAAYVAAREALRS